ncbi:MAG: decaprenyl-phosphate phosphoribosyltransferase [Candidatus Goldbacteria bacterium]|nr:decaprenyl-phosphate phosphoribosyltransferase [Candidatus Goldiibacteriota bacterium]
MKVKIKTFFELLRVKQWIKNLLIFIALIFTNNLLNFNLFLKTVVGFILFCFAASSIYIINDIKDAEEDSHHPAKKNRPIASGKIKPSFAFLISILLLVFSLSGSFLLEKNFFIVTLIYILLSVCYTLKLKNIVILDILVVSINYVIRAIAGAAIIKVAISPWLLVCTSLLALFVILAKRRYELSLVSPTKHRKILEEYSIPLLDEMISITTASTISAYSLYTFTSETAAKHNYLLLTIPFVLYGIFRYLYLIHKKNLGGSPENIFLKDVPMIVNIVLWIISIIIIIYFLK